MNAEDLTEIERAGRRCGVCRSGRGWRRFEIVYTAEGEPVALCGSCRARFGNDPSIARKPAPVREPAAAAPEEAVARSNPAGGERRPEQRPDRLRAAVRELPGSFSTATAARAAGLNKDRALARL